MSSDTETYAKDLMSHFHYCDCAQRFKVSWSFVRNVVRHYRESGQIEAKQRGGYQKPIIQDEYLSMIKSLVEAKNDLLLRELCVGLCPAAGIAMQKAQGLV